MVYFFEFLTPFTLGACNFLISNPFLTLVTVSDAPRGGVQVLFGHQKQWSRPPWIWPPLSAEVFDHQPIYPNSLGVGVPENNHAGFPTLRLEGGHYQSSPVLDSYPTWNRAPPPTEELEPSSKQGFKSVQVHKIIVKAWAEFDANKTLANDTLLCKKDPNLVS
jgi:hypothetical protein